MWSVRVPGLPHARGGVSALAQMLSSHILSSPRPWGCFRPDDGGHVVDPVFPTPVGVFLSTL